MLPLLNLLRATGRRYLPRWSAAFPHIVDNNAAFSDEGAAATGWSAVNATLSAADSYLRQTKDGAAGVSSITRQLGFTPANSDCILYGKVRAKKAANANAVIWLLSGSKEVSIWFGSSSASGTITSGAISVCGTTGASTRNVLQIASGAEYETTPVEFALHYCHKFSTLTAWFREADGRWKFKGRVACDWFSASQIQVLNTSNSAAGSWIEFDYLSLCRPNIAVLSDSIGEGKTLFSPNPALGLTNDESTWMRHAPLYPALRNNLAVNLGVGGETSAQMLARVSDATSTGARVVFLHASTNDYGQSVSQAARTTNIADTVAAIEAASAECVLLNAMYGTATEASNPGLRDYELQWWSDSSAGVGAFSRIDIMQPMLSAGYMDDAKTQADKIHPNIAGHTVIGQYIAQQ